MSTTVAFTIIGEPASKANSRELAVIGPKDKRRTILRKSDKALDYERTALLQIPRTARVRMTGPVRVTMRIFYASERPDLDESIVLDVMQDRWARTKEGERVLLQPGVYRNDRQVRSKRIDFALDRANPRAEIVVEAMRPQQADLVGAPLTPGERELDAFGED